MLRTKVSAIIAIAVVSAIGIGVAAYALLNKPEATKNQNAYSKPFTQKYTSKYTSYSIPYNGLCESINRIVVDFNKSIINVWPGKVLDSGNKIKIISNQTNGQWVPPDQTALPYPLNYNLTLFVPTKDRNNNPVICAYVDVFIKEKTGYLTKSDISIIYPFEQWYSVGQGHYSHDTGYVTTYIQSKKAGKALLEVKINNKLYPYSYEVIFK